MKNRIFNKNIIMPSTYGGNHLNYPGTSAVTKRANYYGEGHGNNIDEADETFGHANSFAFLVSSSSSLHRLNQHRNRPKELIRGIRSGRKASR